MKRKVPHGGQGEPRVPDGDVDPAHSREAPVCSSVALRGVSVASVCRLLPFAAPPMSDALLPYYERELDAIKRLAAEFAETHPKIAGRLRLSAECGGRSARRPAARRRGVPRRTRAPPAGRRISRTDRCSARPALPALPGARAVLHGGAVRLPARPDQSGAAARGHRDRHRTGARRGASLPHHGTRHAMAGRGGERPPLGSADRGTCQPDRRPARPACCGSR